MRYSNDCCKSVAECNERKLILKKESLFTKENAADHLTSIHHL